jgi:TRAP-type C4-dicarboxylate transport system permease small subunit
LYPVGASHTPGRCTIHAIKLLHRWLGLLTEFVAGTILAIMTVLVFLTVIYRYFLLAPISWGEEMARFLFIALSLFGAAIAMKDGAHFRITILAERFSPAVRTCLELLVALATSLVLGVVLAKGWGLALLNRNQESPALGVPMSVPYMAVPLGALLMLLFAWTSLLLKWHDERTAESGAGKIIPGPGLE